MSGIESNYSGSALPTRLQFKLRADRGVVWIAADGYAFATISAGMNDREICAALVVRLWNEEQDRIAAIGGAK